MNRRPGVLFNAPHRDLEEVAPYRVCEEWNARAIAQEAGRYETGIDSRTAHRLGIAFDRSANGAVMVEKRLSDGTSRWSHRHLAANYRTRLQPSGEGEGARAAILCLLR